MSDFWSGYIIAIIVINIVGCFLLLHFTRKKKASADENETTGHVYDGIEEYDKPMPRWWLVMFYITIVFSIVYLILYPGLGKFQGVLGWSKISQYEEEMAKADEKYLPLFKKYSSMSIESLQQEPEALAMGQSIFANTCFGCHGADARGGVGFPDLTDNDWIYGGTPEDIIYSITEGRNGAMPAWGETLGEQKLSAVLHYVLSENEVERTHRKDLVEEGKEVYQTYCQVCHSNDLSGNQELGAPNLKDDIWLHGGSITMIKDTIRYGVNANMPKHKDILGKDKIHLVAAYVYSLSQDEESQDEQ
ncbi:cytochrome-c oxidase, cbb3-type subunit III [Kangiella spongicola]|uniref:Cbb3-type cytochrome c oxidase subunit n=1 Tax=Kangiella spongicola TaxID=796379 RepID=A0A318D394_9GAMM|nr:cytochrome-c oxidase, cbb3-type subunit III [Kangiella spongicola]PXF63421.1 cytochrome-c oxidase, cbb3-type subunit III [Kangiella spongicola]